MNSTITIFTDGGSRGNPGRAAYGFVIYDEKKNVIYEEGKYIGIETNNIAEYSAVVESLRWVVNNMSPFPTSIHFFLDSQLIERQMKGLYKIKNEKLKELFKTAGELMKELDSEIVFTHVPRAQNQEADRLVNTALDAKDMS